MKYCVPFFILAFTATNISLAAPAICQNPNIKIAGPREVVYKYKQDRCSDMDVPDTPAMAFKDANGKVHLFNGFSGSYMSVGTSLNNVRRDCSRPFTTEIRPGANNTPASFDNWKWFRSPWTPDGKTIYGLVHNEFHGWENAAEYCPSGKEGHCLYPNVTASISTDGGKTFHVQRDAKGQVILGLVTPYAYNPNAEKQAGIRAPTNIISRVENGKTYYYVLANNRHAPDVAQKAGTCLYRSDDISDPSRWRAWNGKNFSVVVNATVYHDKNINPHQHICQPVFPEAPSSWTYNTTINQYIAIVGMHGDDLSFAYTTSPDMLHWSQPKAILKTTFNEYHHSPRGSGIAAQTYPSLLDPQSAGLNFEFSGNHPYLYFTRFNPREKGGTWHNRDLIRVPLAISCED